uniref:Uncharacterized protein n=1 Tax=Globisporangium ultimum (strain ATCC 200006 / CBS 805.95 / DAOM BR144) TaxID=431595 RepID=K3W8Y3_GLOUD
MAERANDHHSARLLVAMAPAACQYQSPDHTALLASGSRCEDAQTSPDSLPETTALNDADVVFALGPWTNVTSA